MLKQIIAFIAVLPSRLRNRPKILFSAIALLLATTVSAFYLWNDVKASGSWKSKSGSGQWHLILLEKGNGNIEGTGSILGEKPLSFTINGFRTDRYVSSKIHVENEDAVFQGKLIGRNELTGVITTSGGSEEKGINFTISLFRE